MKVDRYDLGVIDGILVSGSGRSRQNLYVRDGRVAAVTAARLEAERVVDGGGLFVMPGMIDAHVHFMDPGDPSREDFPTGSGAAAAQGVTTVIEHTHGWPVRTPKELRRKLEHLRNRSHVDFALGAHVWPDQLDQIQPLWWSGVDFFKVFTCATHGVPATIGAHLRDALLAIDHVDGLAVVHAEDDIMTAQDEARLREMGRDDSSLLIEWRSLQAEELAVATTVILARATRARVVIAHASSPRIVELAVRLRGEGSVYVESCPQYLLLLEGELLRDGPLRKFTPPARARSTSELECMWALLSNGLIDYISSDHAPSTRAQKLAGGIWEAPFGLPGIDTTFPLMLDAALQGRISLEHLVQLYSMGPARIHRLFPRKGHLGVGADADMVIVDPTANRLIDDTTILSMAGWSPYAGRNVRGGVVDVILRGQVVVDRGVFDDRRLGQFLPGPGYRATR